MGKRLSNTQEVFHYWANTVQERGECGNVSFVGPDAYSYARCIATIHTNARGGKLVLFGSVGRDSATTSRHQYHARRAVSHLPSMQVLHNKPHLGRWSGQSALPSGSQHQANLDDLVLRVDELQKKAARARAHKNGYLSLATDLVDDFDRYAEFFDLPDRFSPDLADKIRAEAIAAEAAWVEAIQKRTKERDAELQEDLGRWRQGGHGVHLYGLSTVALRLKDGMIQTSKGAEIPVADAIKLWPIIQRCRNGDKCFSPGQPVGVYSLTKIREDGSLVVGCHDIPYVEIESIAQQLGLEVRA